MGPVSRLEFRSTLANLKSVFVVTERRPVVPAGASEAQEPAWGGVARLRLAPAGQGQAALGSSSRVRAKALVISGETIGSEDVVYLVAKQYTRIGMTASETIAILQNHMGELRRFGVRRIGLFGSIARDEAKADSDIDILVDFEPGRKSFDTFMDLRFRLEELFPGLRVDLVLQSALKPIIRANIESSVRYVA